MLLGNGRWLNLGNHTQLGPERLTEIRHLLKIAHATVVDPLHDLLGAESLLAEVSEKGLELLPGQTQQIDPIGCRGGGDELVCCGHGIRAGHALAWADLA